MPNNVEEDDSSDAEEDADDHESTGTETPFVPGLLDDLIDNWSGEWFEMLSFEFAGWNFLDRRLEKRASFEFLATAKLLIGKSFLPEFFLVLWDI